MPLIVSNQLNFILHCPNCYVQALLPKPYYFSHLQCLQLSQAEAVFCDWDPATLLPDMQCMLTHIQDPKVKVSTQWCSQALTLFRCGASFSVDLQKPLL
jgi:hypothetical protein